MVDFPSTVNPPGGASYSAPLLDFSQIGNWAADYQNGVLGRQQQEQNDQIKQLNQQKIAAGQRQQQLADALQGGAALDDKGNFDPKKAQAVFARFGLLDGVTQVNPMIQQQQAANTPLYPAAGGNQPTQGAAAAPQPSSAPVRPSAGAQGDAAGSVIGRVTDALPEGNDKVGAVASTIARSIGVDPNASLTPEQATTVDRRVGVYLQGKGLKPRTTSADAQSGTFADRFAPANGGGSSLPPSANAVSPAASAQQPAQQPQQPAAPTQGAPIGAGFSLPDNPFTGKPITSVEGARNVVRALNQRMAQLSTNPANKEKVEILQHDRDAIEKAIEPREVHAGTTLLGPSGQVLYSAPTNAGGQAGQLVRQENAERAQRGEAPMTAQEEIAFIQGIHPPRSAPAMAVDAFRRDFIQKNGRAPTGEEIAKFAGSYSGEQSYQRTAGSSGARVENASNEVEQLIPQAVESSRKLPRGSFVPLNQILQMGDKATSDPAYNDFLMANFSLAKAYGRAMNPQGVPRVTEEMEAKAMGILSTATSQQAYEVQVRRLWKEVQASKTATAKTAEGRKAGDINAPVPGMDAAPPSAAIDALKANPSLRDQFDAKYGAGASRRALGN